MLLGMRNRLPGLLAVAALLALAAVVARGESAVPLGETRAWFDWLRFPSIGAQGVSISGGTASSEPGLWLAILGWAALLFPLVLLALAIVAALVVAFRQRRIGPPTPVRREQESVHPETDLAAPWLGAAQAARNAMEENRGGPPSDAVIAAWVELEAVAAGSGSRRFAHQTPTEFTESIAVQTAALDTLRRLYQRARFGPQGMIGTVEAEQAKAALDDIIRALSAEPANR